MSATLATALTPAGDDAPPAPVPLRGTAPWRRANAPRTAPTGQPTGSTAASAGGAQQAGPSAGPPDADGAGSAPLVRDVEGEALVARAASLPPDHPDHRRALDAAVRHWSPMALRLARPFRRRTSEREDLQQVALTALVQAILRYDPERGDFPPYAVPTVTGEIRRWLRDSRDLVRVPRRLRELDAEIMNLTDALESTLGRRPTTDELAQRAGVAAADVAEARYARAARWPGPLEDESVSASAVAYVEEGLEMVEQRRTVAPLIAELDERSRDVLVMRYFHDMTQSDIASRVGVSQVQISRILSRTIAQLRTRAAA